MRSLDCHNFFNLFRQIPKLATQDHTAEREIELSFKKEDLIHPFGDLFNGYSIGINMNDTNKKLGLYPTYKVVEVVVPVKMLNY